MVILYVETNFLVSIATGRDPQAEQLLTSIPPSVQIAMPDICCMEAFSVLEDEKKRRNSFEGRLDEQISQLKRNLTSQHAKSLLTNLEQSRIGNQLLLNDSQARLFQTLQQISSVAEIIPLEANVLRESLQTLLINDPTDNLILNCILNHAYAHADKTKVFMSGNSRDFGTSEIQEALQQFGIIKYFTQTQSFLGWLGSTL